MRFSASGAASLTLAYDPLGRLRSTTASGTTTEFLYDGDRLAAEYVGGALVRRTAHGAGVDEPLVWYEGASTSDRRWLIADQLGSVIASTDASGATTRYAYGPYGEPASWSGARFRYTGQAALPEAQLYHYKARVYDPVLGRFLQTDPIGYEDDFNLYAYVRNAPIHRRDPSGQYVCSGSQEQCQSVMRAINFVRTRANAWAGRNLAAIAPIRSLVRFLGNPGSNNGVQVGFGSLERGTLGETTCPERS